MRALLSAAEGASWEGRAEGEGGGGQQREGARSSSVLLVGTPAPEAGSHTGQNTHFLERRLCPQPASPLPGGPRGSPAFCPDGCAHHPPRWMVCDGKTPEGAKRPCPVFRKHTGQPGGRGPVGHGEPQRRAEPGVHQCREPGKPTTVARGLGCARVCAHTHVHTHHSRAI